MAKQSSGDTSEVEAVAREIFAATLLSQAGRFTPEHIAKQAFIGAEAFVAEKQAYRQNTAKVKGTDDAV